MSKEIRYIDNIEFRAIEEDNKRYIEGYALKFNNQSKDLGGFVEIIEPRSINENTDMSDVLALFNHSMNYVLARLNSEVSTLELEVDDIGLKYKFEVDEDISYVRDLYKNIQKKNITKSSFGFYLPSDGSGERWEKIDDKYYRYITQFKKIVDVSPVTNPAYDNTSSTVRSFEDAKKELDKVETNDVETVDNSNYIYKFLKHKK
jgi:hypothetical protein